MSRCRFLFRLRIADAVFPQPRADGGVLGQRVLRKQPREGGAVGEGLRVAVGDELDLKRPLRAADRVDLQTGVGTVHHAAQV